MSDTEAAGLQYFGIALCGTKKLVNKLTGSMPLLRREVLDVQKIMNNKLSEHGRKKVDDIVVSTSPIFEDEVYQKWLNGNQEIHALGREQYWNNHCKESHYNAYKNK